MYCAKCGSEIKEGMNFCSACGASVEGMSENAIAVVGNNEFRHMPISVTTISQATVNAIYNLLEPLKRISDENEKINKNQKILELNKKRVNNKVSNIILGAVIGFLSWLFFGCCAMLIGFEVGLAGMITFICVGCSIGYSVSNTGKKGLAHCESVKEQCLRQIDNICEKIDPEQISLLPPSYRYYNAASFFYNAFINQRALTMQQAVNLYEDEIRKDQMAALQMQQMAQLRSIGQSAQVSATVNTLSFISRLF